MPNSPLVPTVRRRRLGASLRRLRNEAGMTLDHAATAMGWRGPKLSKIESATQAIRPTDVGALLRVYGVEDSALEDLARDGGKKGWWQTYSAVVSPTYADYISLESDADTIYPWSPLVIPGLLQTAAYARETIAGVTTSRTPDEVAALAEVRMARQAVLSRPGRATELWAIIHEAGLHQRFAVRPATMREQLRRLLDASDMPNVTVQLMPLASTAHPGVIGGFTLTGFPPPMPSVVLLEYLSGATYVEGDDATPFASTFERIRSTALPVEDSLARIAELEESHRKRITPRQTCTRTTSPRRCGGRRPPVAQSTTASKSPNSPAAPGQSGTPRTLTGLPYASRRPSGSPSGWASSLASCDRQLSPPDAGRASRCALFTQHTPHGRRVRRLARTTLRGTRSPPLLPARRSPVGTDRSDQSQTSAPDPIHLEGSSPASHRRQASTEFH